MPVSLELAEVEEVESRGLIAGLSEYCNLGKEKMLSGLKFIPRDQVDQETRKSGHRKEKVGRKKKHSHYSSSDDGLERIKSGSRKKKKWYDSDEDMSSFSDESDSQSEVERDRKKRRSSKKEKKRHDDSLDNKYKHRSKKKSRSRRKDYSSENESSTSSEREKSSEEGNHHKGGMSKWMEDEKWGTNSGNVENDLTGTCYLNLTLIISGRIFYIYLILLWHVKSDDSKGSQSLNSNNVVRKELGLEWMLRPKDTNDNISKKSSLIEPEEAPAEEIKKDNPRELNPYLKDSGSGYPEESDGMKAGNKRFLSNVVVGDGGASWRLKALKRAQEQAAREGRKLEEVVEERWGSMGHLAASVASHNVAPTHAHLRAIKNRRKGLLKEEQTNIDEKINKSEKKSMKDVLPRHPKMRVPKVHDSLSWGKRGSKNLSTEDAALVSTALSNINKFSNDGNFLDKLMHKEEDNSVDLSNPSKFEARPEPKSVDFASVENKEDSGAVKLAMSANQLAAKALQLRMKGKHEEAEKLLIDGCVDMLLLSSSDLSISDFGCEMLPVGRIDSCKEAETIKERQNFGEGSSRLQIDGTSSRFIMHDVSARKNKKEDDGDLHLAQKIMHNHRYSISSQADEYDFDDGPRKKTRKKGGGGNYKSSEITNSANRFLTQQERCQFCFENPSRPKHLVIAIANFTYLALPQQQPVVPGHCGILTLQHESSTRTVEDNVWDEIRNFKKCLIMMFAKQEKDVVFFETVMGLAQQRRHCLVECVPLPRDVAKQAPVYFKKAIDEAEDEWSQHNAKKLIDTSEKGLRGSIPKNFPYFHVEFGLNKGFVHVIDDEKEFKSNFGLNVIRGILQLPGEDMYRRRRQESLETQKQAVASFARDWEPFDWTKQLD
ncbi:hypothetical protein DH2020_004765 [Rehmannia glutinosa]|uniref:CWF19-like protein n=1 Tax=Rehmannia glutinosa TaxID=99300 RepID=A0ABR0XR12_REHGL